MKVYNREYRIESDDFTKMYNFLVKENRYRGDDFIWHIARLVDWKFSLLNPRRRIKSNYSQYTRLWFDNHGELLGFVLSEDINSDFQVFTNESNDDLYREMVEWFIGKHSHKYKDFKTMVNESHNYRKEVLKELGFNLGSGFESTFVINTHKYSNYELNDSSIEFISMKDSGDYIKQMELRDNAWPKKLDFEEEIKLREYIRTSPIYRADFDFVLVNSSNRFISGCEAFIDAENNTSELERVCTHSDFWNRGFCKKVLKSTLKSLSNNRVDTAYITAWNDKTLHIYGNLGHHNQIKRRYYTYSLE